MKGYAMKQIKNELCEFMALVAFIVMIGVVCGMW